MRQTLENAPIHTELVTNRLAARSRAGERKERNVAGALDGNRYAALVASTGAQLAARFDLAALTNVAAQAGEILVINVTDVIGAVLAHLAATREAATTTAAATAARAARAGATLGTTAKAAWA